jgi:hypothetical protein
MVFVWMQRHLHAAVALWVCVAFAVTSGACSSNDDEVAMRCDRLRRHVVELRVQTLPKADRAAHAAALDRALGDRFIADCKAMTAKQRDCALASSETSEFASCTGSLP